MPSVVNNAILLEQQHLVAGPRALLFQRPPSHTTGARPVVESPPARQRSDLERRRVGDRKAVLMESADKDLVRSGLPPC